MIMIQMCQRQCVFRVVPCYGGTYIDGATSTADIDDGRGVELEMRTVGRE